MFTTYTVDSLPCDGTEVNLTRVTMLVELPAWTVQATIEHRTGVLEHGVCFRTPLAKTGRKSKQTGLVSHRNIGVLKKDPCIFGGSLFIHMWVISSESDAAIEAVRKELQSEIEKLRQKISEVSFDVTLKEI